MNGRLMPEQRLKRICSVTELVKSLELSRSRFYQLCQAGVFPYPVYDLRTRRPYYTPEQQERCLEIRRTNLGHNGLPILFYGPRQRRQDPIPQSSFSAKKKKNPQPDLFSQEILETLHGMGLRQVTWDHLKEAMESLFPNQKATDLDRGLLIRELFRYFKSQVSS